jgi:hypothetical protein
MIMVCQLPGKGLFAPAHLTLRYLTIIITVYVSFVVRDCE